MTKIVQIEGRGVRMIGLFGPMVAALACALNAAVAGAQFPAPPPSSAPSTAPATAPTTPASAPSKAPIARPSLNAAQDLIAQGSAELFWVARVSPTDAGAKTGVYARPARQPWRQWKGVGQRVVSAAARGSQLALLLENGEWVLSSEEGASTGQSVSPAGSRLLAFAGTGQNLWAIARVPGNAGGIRPAPRRATNVFADDNSPFRQPAAAASSKPVAGTSPATTRAGSATTSPASINLTASPPTTAPAPAASALDGAASRPAATRPASAGLPDRLALLFLAGDGWTDDAEIPADVVGLEDGFSLGFVDGSAYLAVRPSDASASLWLFRLGQDKRWSQIASASIPKDTRGFQTLSDTPAPMVRLIAANAADADALLMVAPDGAVRTVPLAGTAGAPPELRAAAFAAGKVRAVWAATAEPGSDAEAGGLVEQSYDASSGVATDKPVPIVWPREGMRFDWLQGVIVVAMVIAIASSFRRREAMRTFDLAASGLRLAPLPRRLLAGVIDAIPLFAAIVALYFLRAAGSAEEAAGMTWTGGGWGLRVELLRGAALLAYIGHTAVSEVLTGRTLGKLICGLRVVGFDGNPAPWRAVLLRNALRIIDAGLLFVPLILIPFSPLYQRAADAAAGTLVVIDAKPGDAEETEAKAEEGAEG